MKMEDHGYFEAYNDLSVHELMLADKPRMQAYLAAIENNELSGKVVMDVGSGTGVLAMFAARAGAKKVYAVEASDFATVSKELIEANGFGDVIEVVHGKVEDIEISEPVDVIISEWMGFYLLHESMLASVLFARDKFLAPGGVLLPSSATIMMAPVSLEAWWAAKLQPWADVYGLDFSLLAPLAKNALLKEPVIVDLTPSQLLAPAQPFVTLDLMAIDRAHTSHLSAHLTFSAAGDGTLHGFGLWFRCVFPGPAGNEEDCIVLDTSPGQPQTHWKQSVILLPDGYAVQAGDTLPVTLDMVQSSDNPRLYSIGLAMGPEESAELEDESHGPQCECAACRLLKACNERYSSQGDT